MDQPDPIPSTYEAERYSDAVVHFAGVALALVGVPILVALSISRHDDWSVVTGTIVYGVCLIAMLTASAVYNVTGQHRFTKILKRLDHSAIYLKIAGSFTPLAMLTGGAGVPFLAGLWGAALWGTSLKMLAPDRLRWLGLALYLGMGWIGSVAGLGILTALTPGAAILIASGGILYTVGVIFFLWEKLPFHTTIWHGFVLVASALIYTAILLEVLREIDPTLL